MRTCLWFDDQAEEAANFYVSVFRDGKVGSVSRYEAEGAAMAGKEAGAAMTVEFEVEGMRFLGLNGGPMFQFTEAISFMVARDTQEEIDELWDALTGDGGEESQCGWCKDRFGVSWQILPSNMNELLGAGMGSEAAQRATHAMFQMKKLDIEALRRARDGEPANA